VIVPAAAGTEKRPAHRAIVRQSGRASGGEPTMNDNDVDDGTPSPTGGGRAWVRPTLALAAVAAVVVAARATGAGHHVEEARAWILSLGEWAPAAFVVIYAAAVVLAVPGSVLTIAAGAMFGSVLGVVLVSIASTLGATGAFLVARTFARESVASWLEGRERWARLDRLTREHGAIIVAIARLVPLFPFNLLNYGFGLTRIRLGTYVFWSWLCMLPGTVLYVVGADVVTTALARGRVPWVLVAVFLAAVALITIVVRRARATLAEREAHGGGKEGTR
jgi:uncharacterized membrane protein YdjX (TVP38/TMEM64 family)